MIELIHGDCLEKMKDIPDGSIDMILTDPPYGTMKGAEKTNKYGSKANPKHNWDEIIDTSRMLNECNRVLRTNGALVLFAQEPYTSHLITSQHGNLPFSYRMTWLKDSFAFALGAKKAPVNYTEDVCVFFKKYEDKTGHPLQEYFLNELAKTGLTTKYICEALGTSHASHFFTNGMQFRVPNQKYLNAMQELTGRFTIDYDDVKTLHKNFINDKRNKYPVIFNLPDGKKYKSNVLEYKKDYSGHHPTQKPVALLEDLIKTYTNEGQTVLDFTMGSGSTGVAAKNLNRDFIGIELDEEYFKIAEKRVNGQYRRR
jgi:site-specific DNA-methyltransferase (adenine-specific)